MEGGGRFVAVLPIASLSHPVKPQIREEERFAGADFSQRSRLLCPSQQHDSFTGTEAEGEGGGLVGAHTGAGVHVAPEAHTRPRRQKGPPHRC